MENPINFWLGMDSQNNWRQLKPRLTAKYQGEIDVFADSGECLDFNKPRKDVIVIIPETLDDKTSEGLNLLKTLSKSHKSGSKLIGALFISANTSESLKQKIEGCNKNGFTVKALHSGASADQIFEVLDSMIQRNVKVYPCDSPSGPQL